MESKSHAPILKRIHHALEASRAVFARFTPGDIETEYKIGRDPVTEADRELDAVLRQELLRDGEGWLSEESVDDPIRLQRSRVWVVDPLDGTREFVTGIPEFCVSIGFVENGRPVAGGIYNPATDESFLGSIESGAVSYTHLDVYKRQDQGRCNYEPTNNPAIHHEKSPPRVSVLHVPSRVLQLEHVRGEISARKIV